MTKRITLIVRESKKSPLKHITNYTTSKARFIKEVRAEGLRVVKDITDDDIKRWVQFKNEGRFDNKELDPKEDWSHYIVVNHDQMLEN